jgi:6-pyruvoyl-tetrahydropterin synthase
MNEARHVTVQGVRLRFAASHMATLGDVLEPLHGHNYIVTARVDGDLTSDHWMVDFSVLKRLTREACEYLDHHFLLQAESTLLRIEHVDGSWNVGFGDREYRFPETDVIAIPIQNSTAELLAEWIAARVIAGLQDGGHTNIRRLAVDVEEMPGQTGGYARDL